MGRRPGRLGGRVQPLLRGESFVSSEQPRHVLIELRLAMLVHLMREAIREAIREVISEAISEAFKDA